MSTKEVCEYLGISHDTLRRRVKAGKIVPIKKSEALDKQPLFFARADVERLKSGPPSPSNPGTPRQDANG